MAVIVGVTDGLAPAEFEGVTVGVFVAVIVGVTDGLDPTVFDGVCVIVGVGVGETDGQRQDGDSQIF